MLNIKNKTQLLAIVAFISITLFFLLLPKWYYVSDISTYRIWRGGFGVAIFYLVKYILPVILLADLFFLISYYNKFYSFFKGISLDNKSYFLQDVLPERQFTVSLFYRFLAFVYFFIFIAILWQFQIVSENGLIPYREFVDITWKQEGVSAIFIYPSIFWLSQSNTFLYLIFISGLILSVYSILFRAQTLIYFYFLLIYLSMVNFGRDLFVAPWDTFLVEVGFLSTLALFFINRKNQLPRILLIALLLLFFRQWFSMAMVKTTWHPAEGWLNLTIMKQFWLFQPMPTIIARYVYEMPMVFHRIATFLTLVLEFAIPLAILFGRKGRYLSFLICLILSFSIQLNGNYGFFNLLTAIMGIWCLDDNFFKLFKIKSKNVLQGSPKFTRIESFMIAFIGIIISINLLYVGLLFTKHADHHASTSFYYFFNKEQEDINYLTTGINKVGQTFSRFRIVSPHGAFKGVADERRQIQIHVRTNNGTWHSLSHLKGHDLDTLYFISPVMNYLPLVFSAHWGTRISPYYLLDIYPDINSIPSYKNNLIKGIFEKNPEIGKIYGPIPEGKIEEVRVLRMRLHVFEDEHFPFKSNSPLNEILDDVSFYPGDKIDFSVFDRSN